MKSYRLANGGPCNEHGLKATAKLQVNIAPAISLLLCPDCIKTLKGFLLRAEQDAFNERRQEVR